MKSVFSRASLFLPLCLSAFSPAAYALPNGWQCIVTFNGSVMKGEPAEDYDTALNNVFKVCVDGGWSNPSRCDQIVHSDSNNCFRTQVGNGSSTNGSSGSSSGSVSFCGTISSQNGRVYIADRRYGPTYWDTSTPFTNVGSPINAGSCYVVQGAAGGDGAGQNRLSRVDSYRSCTQACPTSL